jgi:hypothetical protein
MSFDRLFEKKLQEARERGEFDDLAKSGPITFQGEEFVPEDERMALSLLKQHGYAPAWIEDDKGLRQQLSEMRSFLSRAYARYRYRMHKAEGAADRIAAADEWKTARVAFEQLVAGFNREIFLFNLRAPSLAVQRLPMRASEEYEALGL